MDRQKVFDQFRLSVRNLRELLKKLWNSNLLKIFLITCIFFLLLLDYFGLSLFKGTVDCERFGTVGDWFSNFATLITIIVAALTIINDKRIAESDRKYNQSIYELDQLERERERLAQQELLSRAVYAWINGEQDHITGEIAKYKLFLSNKTGAPVFEWNIYTEDNTLIASSNDFGPLFPESIKEIGTKQIKQNISILICFKSFDGKRWIRNGSSVKEVTHD